MSCFLLFLLQVFESLRSQGDYEGLLRGLRAAGGSGSALPGLWVKGIAAQMRGRAQRVGRCGAAVLLCSHVDRRSKSAHSAEIQVPVGCLSSNAQLLG
jgi:hypothetical protein